MYSCPRPSGAFPIILPCLRAAKAILCRAGPHLPPHRVGKTKRASRKRLALKHFELERSSPPSKQEQRHGNSSTGHNPTTWMETAAAWL